MIYWSTDVVFGIIFASLLLPTSSEICSSLQEASMGAKKPLVFLYENDDRTFACVSYLYFSIIDRPTPLLYTTLQHLYTDHEAGNAYKTNEKQRKTKNTESKWYDAHIKQQSQHRDLLQQWSNEKMHIRSESLCNKRLILRTCAPYLCQEHILTPANAPELSPKTRILASLHASFDKP